MQTLSTTVHQTHVDAQEQSIKGKKSKSQYDQDKCNIQTTRGAISLTKEKCVTLCVELLRLSGLHSILIYTHLGSMFVRYMTQISSSFLDF